MARKCAWCTIPWAETPGTVAGLPATPRLNGEFWQLIRCGYRRELRHSQSERLVVCDTPFLQGYITTREELTEASNELFSLIASGVIKVDVAEQQKYPLKDAQRAHEILESRATQGSSLLIP